MNKLELYHKYINDNNIDINELVIDCLNTVQEHYMRKLNDIRETNSFDDLRILKYSIFYSNPLFTLRQSNIYYLGYNPAGKSRNNKGLLLDILPYYEFDNYEFYLYNKNYSAFDEQWNGEPGKDKHQIRVKNVIKSILDLLGCSHESHKDVFCTNFYFYRSQDIYSLIPYKEEFNEIHKIFLKIINPKIIICNGNNDKESCYKNIKNILSTENDNLLFPLYNSYSIKYCFTNAINNNKSLIIGLPHLSYANPFLYGVFDNFIMYLRKEGHLDGI